MVHLRCVCAFAIAVCVAANVTSVHGRQAVAAPAPPAAVDAARLMDDVRTLSSDGFDGRRTGSEGGRKARAFVVDRFKTIGLPPAFEGGYEQPFTVTPKLVPGQSGSTPLEAANVVARCAGTDASLPVFVASAHFDHLGVRNGQRHPGADDNASGTAVLLALAQACRDEPFRHTVLFAAFDAEELGLEGARAFLAAPPVPRDRIALNVNLDMVARGDKGELYAAGLYHTPSLKPALDEVAARAPIALRFGHDRPGTGHDDWTMQSDHGRFHQAKIPFVYFGVEDHPDYHKPSDTADKIDPQFFGKAAAVILDALRTLDRTR
ncbi:MAG: M28 family peptidase [Acidobacteria bacterium]|nr:M28 family peptidase [Acidobacteriota bacterium]